MKKILILAALAVSLGVNAQSNTNWPKEPTSFAGVELGKTLEESGIDRCGPDVVTWKMKDHPIRCYLGKGPHFTVNGFPFEFAKVGSVSVDEEGKVVIISLRFGQRYFQGVKEVLHERYGSPGKTTEETLQNAKGAKFVSTKERWTGGSTVISTTERSGRVDESSLLVLQRAYAEREMRKGRSSSSDTASKL